MLAFPANSFRKIMSFPGKERLCPWRIKTSKNFLNQSSEPLSPGFHLKFSEQKAQHSFTVFITNSLSYECFWYFSMEKCIFPVL